MQTHRERKGCVRGWEGSASEYQNLNKLWESPKDLLLGSKVAKGVCKVAK